MEMETIGDMLRFWRKTRRMSQLDLALEARSSTRHLSFIEAGRAQPSREMVLALAGALEVPLRERNLLLTAAGFAAVYKETGLDEPEMAQVRHALTLLLKQHEPFGAVVLDRRWNIVMANRGYERFLGMLLGPRWEPRGNALRNLFAPDRVRPHLQNWSEVIAAMLPRVQREAAADRDPQTQALLAEILAYPDVAAAASGQGLASAQKLLIPLEIAAGALRAKMFTTITTLGTPQDITLQELRIESFHPADEATEKLAYELAAS